MLYSRIYAILPAILFTFHCMHMVRIKWIKNTEIIQMKYWLAYGFQWNLIYSFLFPYHHHNHPYTSLQFDLVQFLHAYMPNLYLTQINNSIPQVKPPSIFHFFAIHVIFGFDFAVFLKLFNFSSILANTMPHNTHHTLPISPESN